MKRMQMLAVGLVILLNFSKSYASDDPVVARIGDIEIKQSQLDVEIKSKLQEIELIKYRLRKEALQNVLNAKRIELAAQAVNEIPKQYLISQVSVPPESISRQQAIEYMEAEGDGFVYNEAEMADDEMLFNYARVSLREQMEYKNLTALLEKLEKQYPATSFLPYPLPPTSLRIKVDGPDDLSKGRKDSPIRMDVYSGFDCGYCQPMAKQLDEIMEIYPGKIRYVFHHYPLGGIASEGGAAAMAAQCANEQSKFWAYHDQLHESDDLVHEVFMELAKKLKLKESQFEECLTTGTYKDRIMADIKSGKRLSFSGTPATIINGIMVVGIQSKETYLAIIDTVLRVNDDG